MSEYSFYDLFKKQPQAASAPIIFNFTNTGDMSAYAQAALAGETAAVANAPKGTRNHTLNKAAFSLGQLIAGGMLPAQTVWDTLTAAATQAGLDPTEIERTLRSGGLAGQEQPRAVNTDEWDVPATITLDDHAAHASEEAESDLDEAISAQVLEHLPILDWHELWADDTQDEWILYPLVAYRRATVLYSPPKVGKSLFCLQLAAHIAEGQPWLGVQIDRPHNVLYVDFENDPVNDIRARLQAMGYTPDRLGNLKYLSFPTLAGFDTPEGSRQLLAAAHTYQCDLIVIDTVSRAVTGDENENDTWLRFYRNTGLALKQQKIAVLRLDHTGKDESKGQRGGSAKSGDVDAIWKLSKVTDDGSKLRLQLDASRMRIADQTLILDRTVDPLDHKVMGGGTAAAWDAKISEIITALDDHDAPADMGRDKARELLAALGFTASNKALTEALRVRKENPYKVVTLPEVTSR